MFRKISLLFLFFAAGIITGVGVLWSLGSLPLPFNHPALEAFGVRKPEIVGFLPYWLLAQAQTDYSQYITTLTYFGLAINSDGHIRTLDNPQEEEPGWTTLRTDKYTPFITAAKQHNLKQSLLVISGDDSTISELINDPVTSATNLVTDVAPIMKDKGFTDLNLDIESFLTASESARTNFTMFVSTVKQLVDKEQLGTVTLDLIPISLVKNDLYDARAIGTIVDKVVLMTYDYHYLGGLTSGAIAPVGGAGSTVEYDVETAVKEALKVIPKEKLLLGIPLYGYEWETISDATESATIPGGASTASTRRIADILAGCATCSAVVDSVSREPYLIYPENNYFNQIYYENEASMKEKIALAQKYRLAGVALWALGYEDGTILRPLSSYKNTLDLSGF